MLENKIRDLLNGNVRIQKEFLSGKILFRKYFHRNIMKPIKIHVNMLKTFTSSKSILVTFMTKWEIPLHDHFHDEDTTFIRGADFWNFRPTDLAKKLNEKNFLL